MTTFVSLSELGTTEPDIDFGEDTDIEAALAAFEAEERAKLGLPGDTEHYVEAVHSDATTADPNTTTLLVSGLTMSQDYFVSGALKGLGFRVEHLDCPDNEALRYGKEFGNRGQCNPTYYTVGNLVKHLSLLRDGGMSTEDIIDKYVFLTSGSCGPCRFGMYVTEYRKALRDAGFDGFRVLLFEMNGGINQASGKDEGLVFKPPFFVGIAKALFAGDVLNGVGYRIRPYEVEAGATDAALERCKTMIHDALAERKSVLAALWRSRRILGAIKVDRLRIRPKVGIIGEFWAMTTEGDGSYKIQSFLEGENAEVEPPLVTQWICFMIWEGLRDTRRRMVLRKDDTARKGLDGKNPWKKIWMLKAADVATRGLFQTFAKTAGLHGYKIPDMHEMAEVAAHFYHNDVRGGEAHLEVAKLITNVVKSKVNMTLSLKPFGCMPSSGVSDGVQSAITELYPEAIFLPIETSGDGAVNVYSRVQMMLFKARKKAAQEVEDTLSAYGMTIEEVESFLAKAPFVGRALFRAPHRHGSTAADVVELVGTLKHPVKGIQRWWKKRQDKPVYRTAKHLETPEQKAAEAAAA